MVLAWNQANILSIASHLLSGKVAFVPTDTLYGILACASSKDAVKEVYGLKGRDPSKPVIILISKLDELKLFSINPSKWQKDQLKKFWPGKFSLVLPCNQKKLFYLHRGTKSLAFRLPDNDLLQSLLSLTGPLIAPSANPEGEPPSMNILDGISYFKEKIGLFVDNQNLVGHTSTLISLVGDKLNVLRGELPKDQ